MPIIPDWLHQRASLSPDRLALIGAGARWSFRELDGRVSLAAERLRDRGLAAGERVALLLVNGAPFAVLYHALARLGAIAVPINVRLTPAEIQWQLEDARVRWLIHDVETAELAAASPGAEPLAADAIVRPGAAAGTLEPPHFDLEATHSILYTSGTTGRPKGARLTYGNHWWSAVGSALNLGVRDDDVWLACLPLFHVGGLAILLRSAIGGFAVVVQPGFDPAAVNRAIVEDRVTIVSVVSTMLYRMLAERGGRMYPGWLRCVLLGGGPAPHDLLEACARGRVPVVQTYGLTEAASQVATLAPAEALNRLGSAGRPLMGMALRIEGDGGALPAGEVGEITIRGPAVTPGYFNDEAATRQAWRGGWFHTGDAGYLDAGGFLYVVDRRDDLIISGGENVYPAEVEAVLRQHPDVEDAGVVGVPSAKWGCVPAAFIRLRPGARLQAAAVQQFCAARLAGYKVPAHVQAVDDLPRNAAGKLLRRALAARWPG